MTAPNLAAITASLERSLQNCSLNHHHQSSSGSGSSSSSGFGFGRTATSDSSPPGVRNSHDATLDLNSHLSLPYHWEQCLDLKTGEVYYINWRTGMKAREDPRIGNEYSGELYSEEEEEDNDDDSSYDSDDDEGSSTETSPSSSSKNQQRDDIRGREQHQAGGVLVVAGCKSCLMYFMLPKQEQDCPKCAGQLLHFDRSDDNGPP